MKVFLLSLFLGCVLASNIELCTCSQVEPGSSLEEGAEACQSTSFCGEVSEESCKYTVCLMPYTKEITLEGENYSGDDLTSWLNDCTTSVTGLGCSGCECTEVTFDDEIVIVVSGEEEALDKLHDHIEDSGIEISGQDYTWVEEEDDDGMKTLIVTIAIFSFMALFIILFFCCATWPNSPDKIAAREKLRKESEEEKAHEKATTNHRSSY